ncbi:MAG: hypothetical protein WC291_02905, partial [Thermodesulfovibrionales bacterium]
AYNSDGEVHFFYRDAPSDIHDVGETAFNKLVFSADSDLRETQEDQFYKDLREDLDILRKTVSRERLLGHLRSFTGEHNTEEITSISFLSETVLLTFKDGTAQEIQMAA